jgi:2-dehydro-3-deoxyphosphooctonate aldolase (KDO 8-P synthase)
MNKKTKEININRIKIGGKNKLCLIAGLCVIETKRRTVATAKKLAKITKALDIPFIFKASYDKANRSSIKSYRGPGIEKGLEILKAVRDEAGCPVVSCAATKKPVNIKKGQFMAPWDMANVIEKARSTGNENIMVTERGTSFGYNNLVVDMRSLLELKKFKAPVVFDATHSVQLPGGEKSHSGGDRSLVPHLACAAAAVGIDALFVEVHENPAKAKSDAANSIYIDQLEGMLEKVLKINEAIK